VIPNLSIVWIITLVLLLAFILDRLLFRPIARVVGERQDAIRSAQELASSASARAESASREYEAALGGVRAEGYKLMDEKRREALARRARLLSEARADVERSLQDVSSRLDTQVAEARERLRQEADVLATLIVERVLDRKAS